MIEDQPNPPGGASAEANWLRRLWQAVRANKILPGRGYKVKRTSAGVILEIEAGSGGGKSNDCPYG